eukprot:gb/GECG01002776.1/.p1 GENE.gb/GECG01002776.1/~~gb/GECG01002776.1/.p1  ORF type:complete len:184 (+),score=29.58 gb/GECG01002776.1/:1-552(+)
MEKQNENPTVYSAQVESRSDALDENDCNNDFEEIDALEVFETLRNINDPEHPLSLEQLNVVSMDNIHIDHKRRTLDVFFTPTIPHCSMATLIGLCIRVKLLRSLPPRFKIRVKVTPGTHASEDAVNKQLNDKERVAAALENTHLLEVVNRCIRKTDKLNLETAQAPSTTNETEEDFAPIALAA